MNLLISDPGKDQSIPPQKRTVFLLVLNNSNPVLIVML